MFDLSPDQLFAFALSGVLLSLVFEYFPKVGAWFNSKSDNVQRGIILGSGLVTVLAAFGLSCLDAVGGLPWACSSFGLANAVAAFIAYIMASQSTYLVLPKRSK